MPNRLIYIVLTCLLLVLWEVASQHSSMFRLLLSSPSLVVGYFWENYQDLFEASYTTLIEAVLGLLIAVVFSFGMMIVCFYKPSFMTFILPVMVTSQVVPLIVLAPFFIILFGIGLTSKIAMAAVISFFPIFVNFAQGYKAISQNVHELMLIYNASLRFRIKEIYFPLSMPSIMAGLKVSATLSVIGAIVAEFSGAEIGLGRNLFISAIRIDPDQMVASLVLSTIIGLSFYKSIQLIEKKLLRWYPS